MIDFNMNKNLIKRIQAQDKNNFSFKYKSKQHIHLGIFDLKEVLLNQLKYK